MRRKRGGLGDLDEMFELRARKMTLAMEWRVLEQRRTAREVGGRKGTTKFTLLKEPNL